jgi:hypothetical protein
MPKPHLLIFQFVALGLSTRDIILHETNSRCKALHTGKGLHVLFLFVLTDGHAGIQTAKTFDDLRTSKKCDALGVIVHDILRKVGPAFLAET